MSVKQALANATLATLSVVDQDATDFRGTRPNTRSWMKIQGEQATRENNTVAKYHLVSAIPLVGAGFDAFQVFAKVGDEHHSWRSQLGAVVSLGVNAGGWIAALATGNPLLAGLGSGYHLLLAGVDATQARLHTFAAEHASLEPKQAKTVPNQFLA